MLWTWIGSERGKQIYTITHKYFVTTASWSTYLYLPLQTSLNT